MAAAAFDAGREPGDAAHEAAVAEVIAGGLGLLAAALGSLRGDPAEESDRAATTAARLALVPALPALTGLVGPAADHAAGPECRSCPVCRLIAVAREVAPDLVDSVGDALDAVVGVLRDEAAKAWD